MDNQELDSEQTEAVKRRVPEQCPFCKEYQNSKWNEFKVLVGRYYYVDKQVLVRTHEDVVVHVFCTRCEEEVREEDLDGNR